MNQCAYCRLSLIICVALRIFITSMAGSCASLSVLRKTTTVLRVTNLTQIVFLIIVYSKSAHVSSNQVLIIRSVRLYRYDLWYVSLLVGDRAVRGLRWDRSVPSKPTYRDVTYIQVTYTGGCIYTFDCHGDERLVARNMRRIGINKYKKKNFASSWLFARL